jgi:universal stress protein A
VALNVDRRDEPLLAAAPTAPYRLKKILVPIDFSDCSKKALQYALPLAKRDDAALTLLNVVPIPPYAIGEVSGGDCSIPTRLRTSGEQELANLVQEVVRGEVKADTVVRNGSPAMEIVELARILPADIIIISTHGRSGLKHVFLGSVAEYVIRHAPCPVLVVRECERDFLAS